jgi:hypothetical protein
MAKQLIKEAYRMQQLAGLINENYVDLMPINSPFMESEDDDDTDDVESDEVEYDFTSPGKKDEFDTDDDIEPTSKDVKAGDTLAMTAGSKQGKLNKLTKTKDELLSMWKSGELTTAEYKDIITNYPIKDEFLSKWKSGELTTAEYKDIITNYRIQGGKTVNVVMQIKQLQADIDRDLTVDDEDEY